MAEPKADGRRKKEKDQTPYIRGENKRNQDRTKAVSAAGDVKELHETLRISIHSLKSTMGRRNYGITVSSRQLL
jgi:hypothetical protein